MCRYDDGTCVEEWRDVVGYEGFYQVSSCGNIRRLEHTITDNRGRARLMKSMMMSTQTCRDGSKIVVLSHHGRYHVDEIVANAFVAPGKDRQLVLHLDGDDSNCHYKNLVWVSEQIYFEECYKFKYAVHPNEEWRDVVGYDGIYEVSNYGVVRSCGRLCKNRGGNNRRIHSRQIKQTTRDRDGGRNVSLTKVVDGTVVHKVMPVERVVADAFLPAENDEMVLVHINDDPSDNMAENLQWVYRGEIDNINVGEASPIRRCSIQESPFSDEGEETWIPVVGYEGLYEVSSNGNVRSVDRYVGGSGDKQRLMHGVPIRQNMDSQGYMTVSLSKDGNPRKKMVHRLVAEAFLKNDEGLPQVDHINGIRNDNRLSNLRFVTCSENNQYRGAFCKNLVSSTLSKTIDVNHHDHEDAKDEEWRDIDGYEGLYQVSNLGRIRSLQRSYVNSRGVMTSKPGRILKQKLNVNGYWAVWMYKDGKKYFNVVHRMVAKAFVPNPNGYPCVDHINSDREDARATNLRWCTQKQNLAFARECGSIPYDKIVRKLKSPETEIKRLMSICKPVMRDDGKIYASQIDAARDIGYTSEKQVSEVARGKRESCRGHTFSYIL